MKCVRIAELISSWFMAVFLWLAFWNDDSKQRRQSRRSKDAEISLHLFNVTEITEEECFESFDVDWKGVDAPTKTHLFSMLQWFYISMAKTRCDAAKNHSLNLCVVDFRFANFGRKWMSFDHSQCINCNASQRDKVHFHCDNFPSAAFYLSAKFLLLLLFVSIWKFIVTVCLRRFFYA